MSKLPYPDKIYTNRMSEIFPKIDLGNPFEVDFKPLIRQIPSEQQQEYLFAHLDFIITDNIEDNNYVWAYDNVLFNRLPMPYTEELLLSSLVKIFYHSGLSLNTIELIHLITKLFPQVLHCMRQLNPSRFTMEYQIDDKGKGTLDIWLYDTNRDYGYCWWFRPYDANLVQYALNVIPKYNIGTKDNPRYLDFFIDINIF